MSQEYETGYQALGSMYDDDSDGAPIENIVHVITDNKVRWNHIEDLDEFFTRVYQYHQYDGFMCMVLDDILRFAQFIFVILFGVYLTNCVSYRELFDRMNFNSTHKVTIPDVVIPISQCAASLPWFMVLILIMAAFVFFFRFLRTFFNVVKYRQIHAFYIEALKIPSDELPNMTWHEVQYRLMEVQKEQQMCIHKTELTELDIYHRIMRFKNYMISMINKNIIPLKLRIPFVGERVIMSKSLKYNLEMIFFWGPWSLFENNWHLKQEFRNHHRRKQLAAYLSKRILWIGLANLVLSPLIFMWQIMYSSFKHIEIFKRDPGNLGTRQWSLYARLYLRHFNELDHEFSARLSRAYKPAKNYMNIFISPILVIISKQIAFYAGSILAVLIILTVVDEDVLNVEHVIPTMAVLGVVIAVCRACIPNEHDVWCPETMMHRILSQVHYIPDNWKGRAHTHEVKDQFSQLFQYKALYYIDELISPIVTPLMLIFKIRHKSQDIVDFFRNFTVDVTGVGDVCSFAQMDIRRHAHPQWTTVPRHTDHGNHDVPEHGMPYEDRTTEESTPSISHCQAEDGKTEMSLVHFTLTNPDWKPPETSSLFIKTLKDQAQRDASMASYLHADHPLVNSLHSMNSCGYTSIQSSVMMQQSLLPQNDSRQAFSPSSSMSSSTHGPSGLTSPRCKGLGVRNIEGPAGPPSIHAEPGLFAGVLNAAASQHQHSNTSMYGPNVPAGGSVLAASMRPFNNADTSVEHVATEMSFSALYMHALHKRKMEGGYTYHDSNPNPSTYPDANSAHDAHHDAYDSRDPTNWRAHGDVSQDSWHRQSAHRQQGSIGSASQVHGHGYEMMPNIPEVEQELFLNTNSDSSGGTMGRSPSRRASLGGAIGATPPVGVSAGRRGSVGEAEMGSYGVSPGRRGSGGEAEIGSFLASAGRLGPVDVAGSASFGASAEFTTAHTTINVPNFQLSPEEFTYPPLDRGSPPNS